MPIDRARPAWALTPHYIEDAEAPVHHRVFRVLDENERTRATILIDEALTVEDAHDEARYLESVVARLNAQAQAHGSRLTLKIV